MNFSTVASKFTALFSKKPAPAAPEKVEWFYSYSRCEWFHQDDIIDFQRVGDDAAGITRDGFVILASACEWSDGQPLVNVQKSFAGTSYAVAEILGF